MLSILLVMPIKYYEQIINLVKRDCGADSNVKTMTGAVLHFYLF